MVKDSIYSQNLNRIEIAVLDYLDLNKFFFEPQKELAKRIGYSRQRTNMAIQSLHSMGILTISRSKTLNRQIKLITISDKYLGGLND